MRRTSSARTERLGDVVVRPQLQAEDPVHLGGAGGQHQDRDRRGRRIAPEDLADLQAVHLRQHEVEDDEVGPVLPGGGQGARAVPGEDRGEAGLAQLEAQHLEGVGLVVHEEDLRLHAPSAAGTFEAVWRMSIAS